VKGGGEGCGVILQGESMIRELRMCRSRGLELMSVCPFSALVLNNADDHVQYTNAR
jgi:hypothetical protein